MYSHSGPPNSRYQTGKSLLSIHKLTYKTNWSIIDNSIFNVIMAGMIRSIQGPSKYNTIVMFIPNKNKSRIICACTLPNTANVEKEWPMNGGYSRNSQRKRHKNRLIISSNKSARVSLLIRCPNALQNFKTQTHTQTYIYKGRHPMFKSTLPQSNYQRKRSS